jgi:hypothetical protein
MSLSNILKEIDTNRPNAEMEVTMATPSTYGSRVGVKKAATEAIKRLKVQYRKELMESTVFIIVSGPESEEFTKLASNEAFECFSSDPEEFFKDLTSRISPTLFGRENVRNLFNIAGNILEDKANELDILSYNGLSFNEKYNRSVKDAQDFVPLIRSAINDQVGPEIVGINAIYSIVDKAINKNHSAEVTPLILNTSDEKFALELYKNLPELVIKGALSVERHAAKKKLKAFLVVAGKASKPLSTTPGAVLVKSVTEESVGKALAAIRSKIL